MRYLYLFILLLLGIESAQGTLPAYKPSALPTYLWHKKETVSTKHSRISKSRWEHFLKKKILQNEHGNIDRIAKASWWIGLIALLCAIYPWYTLFLAIPLGIIAIVLAKKAKKSGSAKRNGKGLGTVALVLVVLWTFTLAIMFSMVSIFDPISFGG